MNDEQKKNLIEQLKDQEKRLGLSEDGKKKLSELQGKSKQTSRNNARSKTERGE